MEVKEIPLKKIKTLENTRGELKDKDIAELMSSIKHEGLLQPIGLVKEKTQYKVVFGNRRLEAFKKLGKLGIPAIVYTKMDAQEFLLKNIQENEHRKGITAFELGRAINDLHEKFFMSIHEISVRLSMEKHKVKGALNIFKDWPEELRDRVKEKPTANSGELSIAQADRILAASKRANLKKKDQISLIKEISKNDVPTRLYKVVTSLLKEGETPKQAVMKSKSYKHIVVNLCIPQEQFEEWEDFYATAKELLIEGMSLQAVTE